MPALKFICTNKLDNCPHAISGEILELPPGKDPICPDPHCKQPLKPLNGKSPTSSAPSELPPNRKPALLAAAVLLPIAAVGLGFIFLNSSPAPNSAPADDPSTTSQSAPQPTLPPTSACALQPKPPADIARLLQYLKQGMNFAQTSDFDNALKEFQSVLNIDPNFLGVHKNVGSAYLRLNKPAEARAEFDAELKLLDCLAKFADAELTPFCYMIETGQPQPAGPCRERIAQTRAYTYYSLACLHSLAGQVDQSLQALSDARKAGFSNVKLLKEDPDLARARADNRFQTLLSQSTL